MGCASFVSAPCCARRSSRSAPDGCARPGSRVVAEVYDRTDGCHPAAAASTGPWRGDAWLPPMNPRVLIAVATGAQTGSAGISMATFISALHVAFAAGIVASLLGAII